MYIDTHCQLNFTDFDSDRAMVIGNAKKAGVKKFIVPGVDQSTCRTALLLAGRHPDTVYAAIGYHPYEATRNPDVSHLESILQSDPNRSLIVAVGECGLDYHLYRGELAAGRKDVQTRLFEEQLVLAVQFNKPVIIHCREAFDDVFRILSTLPVVPRGVFHCFSGSLQDLRMACSLGFFIGIDGNVTYAKNVSAIVPHIPLDRLLLETDAPYLTPVPHRGKRNEPKFIPVIARAIASLRHEPVETIMTQSTRNAQMLFQIS